MTIHDEDDDDNGMYHKHMKTDTFATILETNYQFYSLKGLGRVAASALFLGITLMLGIIIIYVGTLSLKSWGAYVLSLSVFHLAEFFLTALFHPNTVSAQAFLLNHSKQYHMALIASISEYWLEWLFLPWLKQYIWISVIGMIICWSGQILRSISMYISGSNFTHVIAESKKQSHSLVTHGVYKYCRHPSYCGWFWWSVGSQIILCNPFCTLAYTFVSWRFFAERIPYEEETLVKFFGKDYIEYRKNIPSGIPAIP